MLSILNYAFREYLDTILSRSNAAAVSEASLEEAHEGASNGMLSPKSGVSSAHMAEHDLSETLTREDLDLIEEEYEAKVEAPDAFDVNAVDQALMRKPSIYYLFSNLNMGIRHSLLQMAGLEVIETGDYYVTRSRTG